MMLFQPMKLRAIEKFAEDFRNLRLDDAGAVVFDRDPETILGQLTNLNAQFGENACLFARIERVVHALAPRGEQGLLFVVKAEQVTVLDEEL